MYCKTISITLCVCVCVCVCVCSVFSKQMLTADSPGARLLRGAQSSGNDDCYLVVLH